MSTTPQTTLYEKMADEQSRYKAWLLTLPPEEILDHTFEYNVRENILIALEDMELEDALAQALLGSPMPLADVYRCYSKIDTDHLSVLQDCIENCAKDIT